MSSFPMSSFPLPTQKAYAGIQKQDLQSLQNDFDNIMRARQNNSPAAPPYPSSGSTGSDSNLVRLASHSARPQSEPPEYDGGPSPSPRFPDVGRDVIRRAGGPYFNQIGVGTLGDYLYRMAGGDRALNRDELIDTLGVSSVIADALIAALGDGDKIPVEKLIDHFREFTFDGINISDQGIDMALREAIGPIEGQFASFADENGDMSMSGFAALAREAMEFLGLPQPSASQLNAAFRRVAGADGRIDLDEAVGLLGVREDGSFSLGEVGQAIADLLQTAPRPGGPPHGGPPPYSDVRPPPYRPAPPPYCFGSGMPFNPAPPMGPGRFHSMVNDAIRWTGEYLHPAQIDAAFRNIGGMDGSWGVSPWEFRSAFGSMNPSPWQVASAVNNFSWPQPPFRSWWS
ncbi:MAG: hypothetical protein EA385_07825 [Salinarimonadaceae bacterium]|nr:MAG: hypothetical protein EA385_07825 [Salinarimonadaceae bacterium]